MNDVHATAGVFERDQTAYSKRSGSLQIAKYRKAASPVPRARDSQKATMVSTAPA